MDLKFKNISHKLIDSLSDGVYSIALTLLGLSVVELVPEISHSEDINAALREHWPTFFSYALGFVVLYSFWYQYHVIGQYTKNTNAWIVWNHGLSLAWVALLPFWRCNARPKFEHREQRLGSVLFWYLPLRYRLDKLVIFCLR
jgi:uncharacterized membrane protein